LTDTTNRMTVIERFYHHFSNYDSSSLTRLALITVLIVLVHLAVKAIGLFCEWLVRNRHREKIVNIPHCRPI
jgi:hypothetical protein